MAREVAPGERGQRFFRIQSRSPRDSLVEQHVGELLPAPRSAADDRVELRMHHQVCQALALGVKTGGTERFSELEARERLAAGQRSLEHPPAGGDGVRVDLQRAIGKRIGHVHARTGERLDPPDICRRHEVPRRPQHVCPKDVAGIERPLDLFVGDSPNPKADGPSGACIILRLHRAHPGDDVLRTFPSRAGEQLVPQTMGDEVHG